MSWCFCGLVVCVWWPWSFHQYSLVLSAGWECVGVLPYWGGSARSVWCVVVGCALVIRTCV